MTKPRRVNVQDAKTNLSRLLRAVEGGEEIEIARAGTVVARLVPQRPTTREWGCFAGRVSWTDGVFDPLSDEEAALWDAVNDEGSKAPLPGGVGQNARARANADRVSVPPDGAPAPTSAQAPGPLRG
jgi:prevent-host-death family protein